MYLQKCLRITGTFLKRSAYTGLRLRMASMSTQSPRLEIHPREALVDDLTSYTVQGLTSGTNVTLAAVLKEGPATFVSHAHYQADSDGKVDVSKEPALGGSYKGVEPMGLLWAMLPEKDSKPGLRLFKRDVTVPFDINLFLLRGHVTIENISDIPQDAIMHQLKHPRTYMSPGVRRIPVREGRLRGTLFLPPGDGPFPGVMDLFGTAGGLIEYRSALFASRGYASFALAYFNFEDLNQQQKWDMEYFEEALDWLIAHPNVKKSGVGAIGVSKGTELVAYLAIHSPLVKAVVSINGYHCYTFAEHFKNGVLQPVMWPDWSHIIMDPEGIVIEDVYSKTPVPEDSIIPLEKAADAEFMFVSGLDDRCVHVEHADKMMARLERHGRTNSRSVRYPGAGHLLEPPYTPHSRTAYHKLANGVMLFGGFTKQHALAQEDAWKKTLELFNRRLNHTSNDVQSKL